MMAHRSIRAAATLIAALMLLTLLVVGHLPGRPTMGAPSAASAGVHPVSGGAPPLTYHANLFVNNTAPSGQLPPGETISVVYSVLVVGTPAAAIGAKVAIPTSVAVLPTTGSGIHLYPGYVEITISANGSGTATPGPVTRVSTALSFNATGNSYFSTQGVAVMASWPSGQYSVQFEWRWVLTAADGTSITGPWSSPAVVSPALLAKFATPPPASWVSGAPYALCLTGPIGGRTFSVHVSLANPAQQIDDGAVLVPGSAANPYCWNSTLPKGVVPQQAFIHFWEYSTVGYLLYVILVQIVNQTGTTVGGGVGGATIGWLPFAVGGSAAAVVVFILGIMFLFAPHRLHRRPGPTGAGAAAAPAEGPPLTPPPTPAPRREPTTSSARRAREPPPPVVEGRREPPRWSYRPPALGTANAAATQRGAFVEDRPTVRPRSRTPSAVRTTTDRQPPLVPDVHDELPPSDRYSAPRTFSAPPAGDPSFLDVPPRAQSREPEPVADRRPIEPASPFVPDRRVEARQTRGRSGTNGSKAANVAATSPSVNAPAPASRPFETQARKPRPATELLPPVQKDEGVASGPRESTNPPVRPATPPSTYSGLVSAIPAPTPLWDAGPQVDERPTPTVGSRFPDRVSTGTPRLNDLLRGGLPLSSHVLLVGDPFLGKEVALYSFIADGLRQGESAILITGTRGLDEVRQQMIDVFPALEECERNGRVQWIDASGPSGEGGSPTPIRGATVVRGPDDYAAILMSVVLATNRTNSERASRLRVGFLGLGAAIAHGRERAGFAFLQNLVGILKRRPAVAMYTVERGTVTEADLERLLTRMDGAIRFKREQNKTFLSVVGVGEVATRDWVEYRATNRTLIVGSFSLERIR